VSAGATFATAGRVLQQLRRDPRTIVLIVGVPILLEVLLEQVFKGQPGVFQHVGGPLVGLFPFISMFVVTSVAMLRERTSGTLERLMTLPLAKLDLLAGYALAFALMALIQATAVSLVAFELLGLHSQGAAWTVVLLAIANALLGMALGLLASAFAATEFQAVQFMPLLVVPQMLLSGLFAARAHMAAWLRWTSDALPLTYSYDALARATHSGAFGGRFVWDVVVTVGATLLALTLAALTLRRRTG
jgi:ABC-2 type transport system permease protein